MTRLHRARVVDSIVGGCVALAFEASAAEVTLTPIRDSSLYEEYTENSNGAGYLFAGRAGGGGIRRALLRFDVAGAIPPGAQIDSAQLRLTVSRAAVADPLPAALHRLLADWGEAGSNAGERAGTGAAAQPGDATWTTRFYPTVAWLAPGGDFAPTPSLTGALAGEGTYTLGSTPELTGDVQLWLDAPASNYGWILRVDESAPGTARRIDSRESPAATRPALTIEYTEAAPAVPIPRYTLVIVAASLLYLVARGSARAAR
jgi:hypothetical protein